MNKEDKKYKEPLELPLDHEPLELPEDSAVKEQHYLSLFVLFLLSLLSAYVLFAFDMKTNSIGQLLTWRMFLTALIYAVPSFLTSAFLFEKLVQSYSKKMSIAMSLIIAIPMIFLMIMWFLSN